MKEELKIEPSEELAYWVGVVQSDGSFKRYVVKTRGDEQIHISLNISEQSLPMQDKFRELSAKIFNRHTKSYKEKGYNRYDCKISVKGLLDVFKNLDINFGDPPKPPIWCETNPAFFGSYFAGLFDGDGSSWLVKRKDRKFPDCHVKITSGKIQTDLLNVVSKFINCNFRLIPVVHTSQLNGRVIVGRGWDFQFLISEKNYKFFKEFILPHINIPYKKEKLENYIQLKYGLTSVASHDK